MKKQFLKDEIWFALIWIVLYVVGFSYAERITSLLRLPDQIQLVLGLVLSVILYLYIRRSRLQEYYGLCESKGREKDYLWFVPLIVISSANLWSGIARNADLTETVIYMLSMCTVGFLEEVIFRGLLFKGLCKTNVTMAILVSALTFGAGHIVNLFLGYEFAHTLLQIVGAAAIGFCYTAVFLVSGSLLPCILSHIFINAPYILSATPTHTGHIVITLLPAAHSVGYGLWLLRRNKKSVE